jgi:SAM-dependent methyltransferase
MKKLNLGCGKDIRKGWDNVDMQKEAPISADLNLIPYKFARANTYDLVLISAVLEYLDNPIRVLEELWRICKNNAMINIYHGYYNNLGAFNYPNCKHYFNEHTFYFYVRNNYDIVSNRKFLIEEVEMIPTPIGKWIYPRMFREKLSHFMGGITERVYVRLKVIK